MNLMDCYRHAAYMFNMNSIAMLARHEPPEKIEAWFSHVGLLHQTSEFGK